MVKIKKPSVVVDDPPAHGANIIDSKGNRRIYVDLPAQLITRLNVLAAMKNVTKRGLVTQLLSDAINRETQGAKV